ncbi:MAG: C39 family peptidase [Bryobacteraceae bacterium]
MKLLSRILIPFLAGVLLSAGEGGVWLDVPFVKQQTREGCGAAVLSMVLQYWHAQQPSTAAPPDADQILTALYSREGKGIYASQMEQYLKQQGFRTFATRGTWADLQPHLEKGRPLIVALQTRGGDMHYVVVAGVDSQNHLVLKNDPADRKLLKQARADFEKEWKAADNWLLLAVPDLR